MAACARGWNYSCASYALMSKTCGFVLTHFYFFLSWNSWYKWGFPTKSWSLFSCQLISSSKKYLCNVVQKKATMRFYFCLVKRVRHQRKDFCANTRVWAWDYIMLNIHLDASTEWSTYKLLPCSFFPFPSFSNIDSKCVIGLALCHTEIGFPCL